ncbi:FAD-binding protein [Flagellimonas allohymeniacidonis]|uniref:FAD-binding protein n=1 Tax=Flagellimonas allohymeniacidonis TaxID=2517819 RepID=A0A4V2HSY9_9FLAO|nr:FAD-binding protein [Allomuricauda hymeniacidonis]TAI49590.1 FAD-binding protein [Allomuricauda hymeniacidonis]
MPPEGITQLPIQQWTNKHENFIHNLVQNASFKLRNPDAGSRKERYRKSTENFQWLIQHALDNNLKLRAMGSGWSFTKVGVTEGGLIDTASLNFSFPLTQKYVNANYANGPEDLYFLQCGTIVYEVNNRLDAKIPPRSIKASGASNGQTIAGALSTGTHGAAFKVGAIPDFVVGLHIVTGPNTHIWLERASYPVASQEFVDWLDADLLQDDDLFNAALVSFGSFGFIHGVMVETEPQFLLTEHREGNIAYDQKLKKAMTQLDFSDLQLPGTGQNGELYHFEVLFNIHKFEPGNPQKGAFLKYMFKKPVEPHPPILRDNEFTYGDDLLGIISTVLDKLPGSGLLIPVLVNNMFNLAFTPKPPIQGTIREIFNYTKFRGKVASAAIGIDIADSPKALELIVEVNKNKPFPGGLSLRYVKGTKATLGFTKFPNTCVLEMDGVDGNKAREFYEAVWNKFEQEGIAYTLHWGKINFNLNENRVKAMYGANQVQSWIDARNQLLSIPVLKVFENKFIEQCGLNKVLGAII